MIDFGYFFLLVTDLLQAFMLRPVVAMPVAFAEKLTFFAPGSHLYIGCFLTKICPALGVGQKFCSPSQTNSVLVMLCAARTFFWLK